MKAFMTRDTAPVSKKATDVHTNSGLPALIDNYGPAFNDLVTILSLRRQSGSRGEARLVAWLQELYPELRKDGYGNLYMRIGDSPIMFTAHTDTVHYGEKFTIRQDIGYDASTDLLFTLGDNVLGADDGAGVWLLMRMINEGTPGLYYFFRDEEIGGLGSSWVAKHALENLDGIQAIISFDRKGTGDVIATQRGKDCSSKTFREELMDQLTGGGMCLTYNIHGSGSFTDSANFMDIVEECTNLSIGYEHAHTSSETLDVEHLSRLAVQLAENVDWDAVANAIDRNPTAKPEPKLPAPTNHIDWGYGSSHAATTQYNDDIVDDFADLDDFSRYAESDITGAKSIVELVEEHPHAIAELLEDYGFDLNALKDMLCATYGFNAPPLRRTRLC